MLTVNGPALVTGGARGIGRAIAETLAACGADVGVFDAAAEADASEVRAAVERTGKRFWYARGDVRDAAAVHATVEQIAAALGRPRVLVNNAGIFHDAVAWKMSDTQWQEVIETNLSGAFHFCRAVIPAMRAAGGGTIVNISSINGLRGKFGQANYAAAKAGLIGLTKTLARELAAFAITVHAVAPGLIDTPATRALPEHVREKARSEILLGRIGTPQDVANVVAFLCSDLARFLTGQVIRVDGGQYL